MKISTAERSAPQTEVLIPEARQHQRRRYQRSGILVVVAVVVAALLVSVVLLSRGPTGRANAQASSKPVAAISTSGVVYFRPVLCYAAPQLAAGSAHGTALPRGSEAIPSCSESSALTESALDITPSGDGFTSNTPMPDEHYASYPSTSPKEPDYANSAVLLPGAPGSHSCLSGNYRCVLGPSEMTSRLIRTATAKLNGTGRWVVDYAMVRGTGSVLWDKVAQDNFHQILGIELNGKVYSAPLIQPTQSTFSSFDGHGETSGNLTRSDAEQLARAMVRH